MTTEQMSMFDGLIEPGAWVEAYGKELTFDEIAQKPGGLIVMDKSTESHAWFQVVMVERIIYHDGTRRLIYYDGTRQRGYVDERYFSPEYKGRFPARAYEV